ncbi:MULTISPECIES: hypothetical protein [unclassified Bradyrhizobium]
MMKRPSDHDALLASFLALAVLASYLALATLLAELPYDADGPQETVMPTDTADPSSLRYLCLVLCQASTAQFEDGPFRTNIWYLDQRRVILAPPLEMTAMPIWQRGA